MKRSFLIYAFILLILINIFTYAYYSKESEFFKTRYERVLKKLKQADESFALKNNEADYFSLEKNENAQNYFENENSEKTIKYEKLIPYVTEQLLDLNSNPKGNPYTGQDQIGANKFVINKVKILNHRWIIADYSDGDIWGEVILKYFVNDDQTISFEVVQSLLYQK